MCVWVRTTWLIRSRTLSNARSHSSTHSCASSSVFVTSDLHLQYNWGSSVTTACALRMWAATDFWLFSMSFEHSGNLQRIVAGGSSIGARFFWRNLGCCRIYVNTPTWFTLLLFWMKDTHVSIYLIFQLSKSPLTSSNFQSSRANNLLDSSSNLWPYLESWSISSRSLNVTSSSASKSFGVVSTKFGNAYSRSLAWISWALASLERRSWSAWVGVLSKLPPQPTMACSAVVAGSRKSSNRCRYVSQSLNRETLLMNEATFVSGMEHLPLEYIV